VAIRRSPNARARRARFRRRGAGCTFERIVVGNLPAAVPVACAQAEFDESTSTARDE
jgi:hypothetical protein